MLILSTFSYNANIQHMQFYKNIKIFISDHMIGLHQSELATLPSKRWPTYPLRGITLFTLYNNEYYLL